MLTLHGQGIDKLGKGLIVEALSEDGLIEAVSIKGYESFGIVCNGTQNFIQKDQIII